MYISQPAVGCDIVTGCLCQIDDKGREADPRFQHVIAACVIRGGTNIFCIRVITKGQPLISETTGVCLHRWHWLAVLKYRFRVFLELVKGGTVEQAKHTDQKTKLAVLYCMCSLTLRLFQACLSVGCVVGKQTHSWLLMHWTQTRLWTYDLFHCVRYSSVSCCCD